MEIRPFTLHDAFVLADSHNQIYEQPISPAGLVEKIRQVMAENGRCWTITTPQKQPIGYATIEPVTGLPGLVDIDGLIDPQWQRRGLGSRLLGHMGHQLMGSSIRQLSHHLTNLDSPAAHFLRHHAFQISHQEVNLLLAKWDALPLPQPPSLRCRVAPVGQLERAKALFNQLYEAVFGPHPWYQPYSPAELTATLRQPTDMRFLWEGQQAIGMVWLHYPTADEAEIEPIGIVPHKQGRGYGRFLLLDTLHLLHKQAIKQVHLGLWATNQPALNLYQSLGFQHHNTRTFFTKTIATP